MYELDTLCMSTHVHMWTCVCQVWTYGDTCVSNTDTISSRKKTTNATKKEHESSERENHVQNGHDFLGGNFPPGTSPPQEIMSGHVRACPRMSSHVRTCAGMSRHVQACPGMSRHVQACRWRSTCAHRQCSRAPSAASLVAATTHSPCSFSPSPTTRGPTFTPVPRPNPQRPKASSYQKSIYLSIYLNDSAAAAPPQRPELGSSTDAAKRNPELQQ